VVTAVRAVIVAVATKVTVSALQNKVTIEVQQQRFNDIDIIIIIKEENITGIVIKKLSRIRIFTVRIP
jgi:hypothetical protein